MSASAQGLCEFIDASPSPFHVCVTVAQRLSAAGFTELSERDEWPAEGRFFTVRAGSLVAWRVDEPTGRAIPNRRRPHRQSEPAGQAAPRPVCRRLAGGRAAALRRGVAELVAGPRPRHQWPAVGSGRQHHRPSAGPHRRTDPARAAAGDPPGRGPQGGVAGSAAARQRGLGRRQRHPVVSRLRRRTRGRRRRRRPRRRPDDPRPDPVAVGRGQPRAASAPRLDNQATCYAGLEAFLAAEPGEHMPVLVLFDHEEVGSQSDHGAQSELLHTVLERITLAAGGGREDFLRRLPGSMVASGDMAHATHRTIPIGTSPATSSTPGTGCLDRRHAACPRARGLVRSRRLRAGVRRRGPGGVLLDEGASGLNRRVNPTHSARSTSSAWTLARHGRGLGRALYDRRTRVARRPGHPRSGCSYVRRRQRELRSGLYRALGFVTLNRTDRADGRDVGPSS